MSVAAVFDVRISMLSCVFIEIKRQNACCRQPTFSIDSPTPLERSANQSNERFICRRSSERRCGCVYVCALILRAPKTECEMNSSISVVRLIDIDI